MHVWKAFARLILWLLYIASIFIMVADVGIEKTEMEIFYVLTNGMLVFRLLGVWFLPWILHVGCLLYVVYYMAVLHYDFVNFYNAMLVIIPIIVQSILALHLVCFRPGRSKSQRACRVGVHAHIGVCTIIVYYWLICFLMGDNDTQCVLEMVYMFFFLLMILTPQFMSKGQAVVQATRERIRLELKAQEEARRLAEQGFGPPTNEKNKITWKH